MAATVRIAILADASQAKTGFDTADAAVTGFSQRMEVMTNGFDNFGGRVGDTSDALSQMAPAVEALGFTNLAAGMEKATLALDAVEGATKLFSVAQSLAANGTKIWAAAQRVLNLALFANPIGLVVLAIVALVAIFVIAYQKSETFRNIVNASLNAVKAVATSVFNGIKSLATAVWGFITSYVRTQMNIVKTVLNAVRTAATAVWNAIKSVATAVWGFIKSYISTQINIVKSTFSVMKSIITNGWNTIKSSASAAWNGIKAAVSGAINAAKNKFNELKTTAAAVVSRVKSLFSPSALYNAGRELISGLARGVADKIGAVVDTVRRGLDRIKGMLPGSPIEWGPLKGWNNGGAGKKLMVMLASGIAAGAPALEDQMASALAPLVSPTITPNLALGAATGSLSGLGGTIQQITVEVRVEPTMNPVEVGREISRALKSYKDAGGKLVAA